MLKLTAAFTSMNGWNVATSAAPILIPESATVNARHTGQTQKGSAMNRDELEGKAEAVKGKVKQAAGDLTDNADLHDEGVVDEAAGKTQETFGKAKRKVGEAIEDLGDAIKK
jgi:uncharacterized protein YjbJ (UPF0337 family)